MEGERERGRERERVSEGGQLSSCTVTPFSLCLNCLHHTAEEQARIQKVMDALKLEVDRRDAEIKNLQRNLKDAETILVSGWACQFAGFC